jgi:pimeloyl-ACP methyl ester carboxylesterase
LDTWLSPDYAHWSLKPELPHVQCPVLAIHGDQDDYGSIEFPKTISEFAGGLSKMHIIKNCGHIPHRESPDLVLDLIGSVLDIKG